MTNWLKRAQAVFGEIPERGTAVTDDRTLTAAQRVCNSATMPEETHWPPESLDAEPRFGKPHAKLFPFIGRKVRTPTGVGTLLQVFANRVTVVLDSEVSRCSFFMPAQIEPVSREVSQ